jgi:hypothetical protein
MFEFVIFYIHATTVAWKLELFAGFAAYILLYALSREFIIICIIEILCVRACVRAG